MYSESSDQPPLPGGIARKYRPLPPRPSQQQSRGCAAHSGNYHRNRTSCSCDLSSTSTDSARQCNLNGSPTSTKAVPKSDDTVVHTLPESENISDNTPPNVAIEKRAIFHDQWKRLGFIGKGSYGQVYRALDIATGYIFAVKEVNPENKRGTLVQALEDERETLKELEHPNIVRYLGFEGNQEALNIFLEYVPGGTIRSCVNTHGMFKEEVTKSFASQILQGLSYLHSKSILHRDLKSENILVEPEGICKISDFGISKKALEADRGRLYSTMKGTIAYMAPEMIDNDKKGYDSKIDIWSVGCIIFEMWTGKTPWSGKQDMQILMKLFMNKLAPPLPDDIRLSMAAESFRQEFFHIDPEKRPSAVELLQNAYLELPPQWVFPGVDEIGQASESSFLIEDMYSEIEAMAKEINISTAIHARRCPSLAGTACPDMDPRSSSPFIIPRTPPLIPRKSRNISTNVATCTTTSPNTSLSSKNSPMNAYRRRVMRNPDPDDTEDARQIASSNCSGRRLYVYQPPPLPEINALSPYSHTLVAPTSIRFNKPTSQAFGKPINTRPVPTKLLANRGISTKFSSTGSSAGRPNLGKVDYSVGQRRAPYMVPRMPQESDDDDDDDYSPSTWKRPPVDIPNRVSQAVEPVELVPNRNISPTRRRHQSLSSAILRPSVETVYKGLLSENVQNIDLSDTGVARSSLSSKSNRCCTMKSIIEIVEERLYQAQVGSVRSPHRAHFWNSRMEEVKTIDSKGSLL